MKTPPECAWPCDSSLPLEPVHGTEGDTYYLCPCCAETTRVDGKGRAVKVERRRVEFDVSGRQIFE